MQSATSCPNVYWVTITITSGRFEPGKTSDSCLWVGCWQCQFSGWIFPPCWKLLAIEYMYLKMWYPKKLTFWWGKWWLTIYMLGDPIFRQTNLSKSLLPLFKRCCSGAMKAGVPMFSEHVWPFGRNRAKPKSESFLGNGSHWKAGIPWGGGDLKTAVKVDSRWKEKVNTSNNHWVTEHQIPVVPREAAAEVSKIGHYRRGELLWCVDGRANPLMGGNVFGDVFFGMLQWLQWSPHPQLLDVV